MGQGLSCVAATDDHGGLFGAVLMGDIEIVESALGTDPSLIHQATVYDRHSLLHIAAANGRIEILSLLLDQYSVKVDVLNRHKQTPLMLAAMHGKISCVEKLISAGANILMFDAANGRTCLHHAAYYGHSNCLEAILSAARTSHVSASWGFSRFVNIRDKKGATPLHLAARQRRARCVHVLLDNGGLVCASTGGYGFSDGTPLHMAARSGSLDCIRELLAWGADRRQRDASGRIPYALALQYNHRACATLLNPSSSEPLVWPSPLKFISELNQEAKALLEQALMKVNKEREKEPIFKESTAVSIQSCSSSDTGIDDDNDDDMSEESDEDMCYICFDQVCTIEIQECGHRMCAQCTLVLCCHNKPKPTMTLSPTAPVCPFCRSNIVKLVVARVKPESDNICDDNSSSKSRKSWKSRNLSEGGSSSFKGLSASFGKRSRGSGRIAADNELIDKPISVDP